MEKINASSLSGPRSYFTDLDPKDKDYDELLVGRRLKLQLLTKKNIVIAASSIFHDIGLELFKKNDGLIEALNKGIILPAVRDQFSDLDEFFSAKVEYSNEAHSFFKENVQYSIPWSLQENSNWFKKTVYQALSQKDSILRKSTGLSSVDSVNLIQRCEEILSHLPDSDRFLSREILQLAITGYRKEVRLYIENFINLVYRISGSRVVNSEGHFPQSNLTKVGVVGNDKIVSEDAIFWDMYIEAVASHLSTALKLTVDRIDRLRYSDILKLRESFFRVGFLKKYDDIISLSKSEVDIEDPEKLLLRAQEIAESAMKLRQYFLENIVQEINTKDSSQNENALFQIANVIAPLEPTIGSVVGVVSSMKAIPEITAPISKDLSLSISNRMELFRDFINSRIGWSASQKTSLIDAYKELVIYGLKA